MRADHLGCYGYPRNTSPHIDALAETATLYSRAVASAPWTVPTHASLFTGKYAFEHGAHTFEVPPPDDPSTTVNNVNPLHARFPTLAEVFNEEGYKTAAFVTNEAFLGTRWQLDQGFDIYLVTTEYAASLNRRIFSWLGANKDRQFFLFINYMDTHRPYNTTPRPGLLPTPVVQDGGELLDQLYGAVMPGVGPLPHELMQRVVDQYDTAVANVDEAVGALVKQLKKLRLYNNTVIVLTSDHGEFLGEHHLVEHSKDVYEEVLRVPLIIKNPRQRDQQVVEQMTSSTDIPNLIFSKFPFEHAARYMKKFPDAPGNHSVIAENYYTRSKDLFHPVWGHRFNRVRSVIYEWPYKYIHSSDGKHELYNIEDDPAETDNLKASRERADDIVDQPPLSDKEIEKLKSLGYIAK
jgi:arylsulfatase A-like enzyme